MARNGDGTATCDRCGIWLPGYGVLYGLITTDLTDKGQTRSLIFCYTNQCRTLVLEGFVNFPAPPDTPLLRCTDDNTALARRGLSEALLAVDMHPGIAEHLRYMQFCYATGSRDRFLNQTGITL